MDAQVDDVVELENLASGRIYYAKVVTIDVAASAYYVRMGAVGDGSAHTFASLMPGRWQDADSGRVYGVSVVDPALIG